MSDSNKQVTVLLQDYHNGNVQAIEKLVPIIYDQLKAIAHRFMVKENANHTLNTTGLVHEAYLRILAQENNNYQNRSHFYAIVATTMRRILLEVARSKNAVKRGSGANKIQLEEHFIISQNDADQIITIDSALKKLHQIDPRLAQVVELRYFGGMNVEEIAEAIDCSPSTVKRDWRTAKAWLYQYLKVS